MPSRGDPCTGSADPNSYQTESHHISPTNISNSVSATWMGGVNNTPLVYTPGLPAGTGGRLCRRLHNPQLL